MADTNKKYPLLEEILSSLHPKKVKSAADADVEELQAMEKELTAVGRKMGRLVKRLENYMKVPTKIHLVPADVLLYVSEVQKARRKLEDEIAQKRAAAQTELKEDGKK